MDLQLTTRINTDEKVMVDGKLDMSLVNAIACDPYTHGYYLVNKRVSEAFKDGLQLKYWFSNRVGGISPR